MECCVLSDQVTVNDAGMKKEFNFILFYFILFYFIFFLGGGGGVGGLPLIINLILTLPESRI